MHLCRGRRGAGRVGRDGNDSFHRASDVHAAARSWERTCVFSALASRPFSHGSTRRVHAYLAGVIINARFARQINTAAVGRARQLTTHVDQRRTSRSDGSIQSCTRTGPRRLSTGDEWSDVRGSQISHYRTGQTRPHASRSTASVLRPLRRSPLSTTEVRQ